MSTSRNYSSPSTQYSRQAAEPQDVGVCCHIIGADFAEAVEQLHRGSAPRLDEICPEFLKSLDVSGLSWLTSLQ